MATVYEGRHVELGKRAAVKVMFPSLATSSTAAARFLREARAVAQLHHPHIVDVFDTGTTDDGTPFFVMELLEGSTLASWVAERAPLGPESIAALFLPVLSAVANAHRQGVIHRDLKPANIFLASRLSSVPHPMVLDFGISKVVSETPDPSLTNSESLIGTVHYMSPEQTRGGSSASAASDQYAIGVMLYECATGQRPFSGPSPYELMHAIVTAPVAPPSTINPDLPPEFDDLVLRAMHRDPERRYPSVHALGGALLSFAGKLGWAIWGREFAGNAALDSVAEASDASLRTDPDFPALAPAASGARRRLPSATHASEGVRRPSLALWGLSGGLAAYALVCTVLLLQQRREIPPDPAHASAAPPALVTAPSAPSSLPGSSPSAEPPLPAPSAAPVASTPAPAVSTSLKARLAASAHARATKPDGPSKALPADVTNPEMGTNRALIIP
jgi:serine/threonine-protein kinase